MDEFRAALEAHGCKPKRSGKEWQARCPAHDDAQPSLTFREGDKTPLLAVCHAGCSFEAIRDALGLPVASQGDSFEDRIDATYDYTDEDGNLLYQAVRLRDPKSFRQRRQRYGEWEWKLGDVRRVLYRLPELRAAVADGRLVFLVEGEKDADALAQLDFVASCSPMGAGKWRDEYAAALHGAKLVFIIADCDEPGRKHANEVAQSLHDRGIPVKLLDLAPNETDGRDISDLIREYLGPEQYAQARFAIENLVRSTPRWNPARTRRLIPISGKDFASRVVPPDPENDLLGPILRRKTRVGIAGYIGEGKTSLMLQMIAASAYGEQFMRWKGRGGDTRWLVIDLEQGESELARRLDETGISARNGNVNIVHLPDGLRIDQSPEDLRALSELLAQGWHGVALDPAYALLSSEPETEYAARNFVMILDRLRRDHDFCMLIPMHTRKPLPKQPLTLADVYGWSTIARNMEVALGIRIVKPWVSELNVLKDRAGDIGPKGIAWQIGYSHERLFHPLDRSLPGQQELAA